LHHDDVDRKLPSFLHPSSNKPGRHGRFRDEWLRLDQEEPREIRRDYLEKLKLLALIARRDIPQSPEAANQIAAMQRDEAQYAGMVRAYARAAAL